MLVHSLTNVDASKYVLQVLIPSQYCASSSRLASARRVLSASSHMTWMSRGRVKRLISTLTSVMQVLDQTWLDYHLLLLKWFCINSYAIFYGQKPWRTGIRKLSRRLLNRRKQSISRTNLLILYALLWAYSAVSLWFFPVKMMRPLLCSFACYANIYIYQVLDLLELLLSILIIASETFMSWNHN